MSETIAGESRIRRWAAHPAGPLLLVAFALVEATLFPVPTEALLLALVLARPERAWAFGLLGAVSSAAGGGLGYALGVHLAALGGGLGAVEAEAGLVAAVVRLYRDNLAIALVTSGFTPIPYLAYSTVAGMLGVPLLPFLGFSLIGRGIKYMVVAGAGRLLETWMHRVSSRYLRWAAALAAVLMVAWFLVRHLRMA